MMLYKHKEKGKPDVKPNKPGIKSKKEDKQDIKIIKTKLDMKFKKEDKRDIEMMKTEHDISKMAYEEEKATLILGITAIFTVWWILK